MPRAKAVLYGDFETTQPNKDGRVRVYLWALAFPDYKVKHGISINTFMDAILRRRAIIYFHNLKFDFSYIFQYLQEHKIEYEICEKMGTIYSVKFNNIELRDSLNYLNMTLRQIGQNYCEKYKKLDYDEYEKPYTYIPNKDDIKYCEYDVLTLKEGFEKYCDVMRNILLSVGATNSADMIGKKLTNAGFAYEAFKELSDLEKVCIKTTREQYELFHFAYKGGYVYSKEGLYEYVLMLDENSMYPDKYRNTPMPIGRPIFVKTEGEMNKYKFAILSIEARYELKKGYIPIIGGGVGKYGGTLYKSSSGGEYERLVISNYDFKLIKEFYDMDYTIEWIYVWETKTGLFEKYCDLFMAIKAKSKGVIRAGAKVFLNSPYGKTAMSGINDVKDYYLDDDNIVRATIKEVEEDDSQLQYLPIAIAITASARYQLLTTARDIGFDKVVYMDTDSIKFKIGKELYDLLISLPEEERQNEVIKHFPHIQIDSYKLGWWKVEGYPLYFKTLACKKYLYYENDRLHITIAGFNKPAVLQAIGTIHDTTIENEVVSIPISKEKALKVLSKFKKGLKVLCNQSKLVAGGRLISSVEKEIR